MDYYITLKNNLELYGLILLTPDVDFKSVKQKVVVSDGQYKAEVKAENYIRNTTKKIPQWFAVKNPYIIENINKYYELNYNSNFICISHKSDISSRDDTLRFQCCRCGQMITKSLFNAMRRDGSHHGVVCPNCDEHTESIHALVLKQMFKHYHPDSVEEDPSCINPNTGAVMPTDIVNHRLKIAIEVQGQWHKYEKQQIRDKIKKEYWITKGYTFYDYPIDKVSVLEYVKYFFPEIEELPDWIDMNYNKKINLIEAQKLLNDGLKVNEVANRMGVNAHRIYDALHYNKLYYPDSYAKSNRHPVLMLDANLCVIREYKSYAEAERDNNIEKCLIASCIYYQSYYCKGYYWLPKDVYESGNYKIKDNKLMKFFTPVKKFTMDWQYVETFENMFVAAKYIDSIAHKIYEVATGVRKSVKGFKYKIA